MHTYYSVQKHVYEKKSVFIYSYYLHTAPFQSGQI